MAKVRGSKDGLTWEEMIREKHGSEYNRFSDLQAINNLTLLKKWCEEKIIELTDKNKNGKDGHAKRGI